MSVFVNVQCTQGTTSLTTVDDSAFLPHWSHFWGSPGQSANNSGWCLLNLKKWTNIQRCARIGMLLYVKIYCYLFGCVEVMNVWSCAHIIMCQFMNRIQRQNNSYRMDILCYNHSEYTPWQFLRRPHVDTIVFFRPVWEVVGWSLPDFPVVWLFTATF